MGFHPIILRFLIFLFLSFCIQTNLQAQIALSQTRWEGSLGLTFTKDSLRINNPLHRESNLQMRYIQVRDTLVLFSGNGPRECLADTGFYQIKYRHNGQWLLLVEIRENCTYRKRLFLPASVFNYVPDKGAPPRDWAFRGVSTDSIPGIDLYRAYELLKDRPAKQVVVAVIDNGFDLEHEDLKQVIWTNPGEIPGNGIDDDQNGYIDDLHGWNFRGGRDGSIPENEQAAATQFYSRWKDKYEQADPGKLNPAEQRQWTIFLRAKKEYLDKIRSSTDSTDLKFAYNLHYNTSQWIGDDPDHPENHAYGSPLIRLTPNLSHGTHVAGVIAAQRNNDKGIDGVADQVRIMPITATTGGGDERDKDVAHAIRYAANNGARLINLSFSKPYSPDKELVDDAIRYAEKKGVLIIHAAGNDGEDNDTTNHYPLAWNEEGQKASNFITVGWTKYYLNEKLVAYYSDYGSRTVDLFAPGSDILSTIPGNGYDLRSGTSNSAPIVTGIAALLLSYFPELSYSELKEILLKSTYRLTIMVKRPGSTTQVPFSSLSVTGGIVNAYNAVKMAMAKTGK